MNHVRDCNNKVCSDFVEFDENLQIRILGVLEDILLMLKNGIVENFVQETNILIVDF